MIKESLSVQTLLLHAIIAVKLHINQPVDSFRDTLTDKAA